MSAPVLSPRAGVLGFLAFATASCSPYFARSTAPAGAEPTGFYEDQARPDLALLEFRLVQYFDKSDRRYETVCAVAANIRSPVPDSVIVPLGKEIEQKLLLRFSGLSPASQCKREGLAIIDRDSGADAALFGSA